MEILGAATVGDGLTTIGHAIIVVGLAWAFVWTVFG